MSMREIFGLGTDVLNYLIRGVLLAGFLPKELPERFSFGRKGRTVWVVGLLYLLVQMFLAYSSEVRGFLYHENGLPRESARGIWPVVFGMLVMLACCAVLFKERRGEVGYYIIAFYSLAELVRFMLYPFFIWLLEKMIDLYFDFAQRQIFSEQIFERILTAAEFVWSLLFVASLLAILRICLKKVKAYLAGSTMLWQKPEMTFLFVPAFLGLILSGLLRIILFRFRGDQLYTVGKEYPEMNFVIPCISVLCIAAVLFSAAMLNRLLTEHEERLKAEVYRERVRQMEEHIADVERLYDGIRGMKHDMKNYIADIGILLRQTDEKNGEKEAELKRYFDSLLGALEGLDMKCHTGNPVTDVVIWRYMQAAEQKGIAFSCDFVYPRSMGINAFEVSVILNNALENAVEACEKTEPQKRFICLNSYRRENMFFLTIENSYDGKWNESMRLRTDKCEKEKHGYGIKNIKSSAKKYFGRVEIGTKGERFVLTVMLQGRYIQEEKRQ